MSGKVRVSHRCPNHPEMRGIERNGHQLPDKAKCNTLAQLHCFQRVANFALGAFALQRPGVRLSSGPVFLASIVLFVFCLNPSRVPDRLLVFGKLKTFNYAGDQRVGDLSFAIDQVDRVMDLKI